MPGDGQRGAFLERAKETAEVIRKHLQADSTFTAISHNDADGLSSAGIMSAALTRAYARFKVRIVEELREDIVDEISAGKPDIVIFTDIGSGYSELLNSRLEAKDVVVLDHHPPDGKAGPKIAQLNPHEFGIDGATMISAALVITPALEATPSAIASRGDEPHVQCSRIRLRMNTW